MLGRKDWFQILGRSSCRCSLGESVRAADLVGSEVL